MADRASYAPIQKALHWIIAVCVIGMIASGVYMTSIGFDPSLPLETQELRNTLYSLHKSTGFLVLALMIVRLVVRLSLGAPRLPQSLPGIQRLAAGASHLAFYVLLFMMPIIGWAATSAGGFMEPIYGLFSAPDIAPRDAQTARGLFELHATIGIGIGLVLFAHIGGALYHGLIRRDGVFKRMWF